MRATFDIDDSLLRAAESRAAEEGANLARLIDEALRAHLTPTRREGPPFRLRLLTKRGRLIPGVDLADRDSVCERMEGRS